MNHAHGHAESVKKEIERFGDDTQFHQKRIDDPVSSQDDHPGVDPNENARPERQDNKNHQDLTFLGIDMIEKISKGITQKQ
jgi:hypothetical protein